VYFHASLKKFAGTAIAIAAVWGGVAWADGAKNCGADVDCLRQLLAANPVKHIGYMHVFQDIPLDRRVLAAPVKMLEYLNLDNQLHGFPNRPQAAKVGRHLLEDMAGAIKELPVEVKALIDKKLMGIFLVQDLGGTGYTDYVFNQQHEPVGAFVVLDAGVLTRSANAWATWKENTPFIADAAFDLQVTIETPANDNRKQALQYILLHELGHVASVGAHIHPSWDSWDCVKDPPDRYPFFQLSWQLKDAQSCDVISKFDGAVFRHRKDVVYYFGAKLPAALGPEVYAELAQTNFPSLYAATSPGDDFAESFVTYVHHELMGKPFEIRIDKQGQRQTTFTSCWGTPRCAAKQKLIEELFSNQE